MAEGLICCEFGEGLHNGGNPWVGIPWAQLQAPLGCAPSCPVALGCSRCLCLGDWCGGDLGKSLGRPEQCSSLPFASGGLGRAGLPAGLDDLRGPFQPKQFCDLWQLCSVSVLCPKHKLSQVCGGHMLSLSSQVSVTWPGNTPLWPQPHLSQAKSSLGHDVIPAF